MSEPSRIVGVFIEPGKAFRDIAARPRWVVPLLLTIVASLGFLFALNQRVGFEQTVRQQMESSPRTAQLPADQKEKAVEMGMKFAPIMGFLGILIGLPLYCVIASAVLLFIYNTVMSAQLTFKQMFSIMCYSGLPGIIFAALAVVVMYLKNPEEFNVNNPLAFNPGAFLDPMTTSKFVYSVATSLNLFTIWTMVLIAIGVVAAGRKVSFGGALAGVMIPWAVWVLGSAGVKSMFG